MLTTRRPHIAAVKLDINWHPGLSIYASEKFLKAVSDEYGWVGGTDDQGELRCVLPYTVIRKAGCQMIRFRTETLPVLAELDQVEERAFLDGVIEYFRETGADMIIPSGNGAVFRAYPQDAMAAPYGTFLQTLDQTPNALFNTLHTDCRYNVRKAAKSGIEIKCGMQYLDAAVTLIRETLKRSDAEQIVGADELVRIVKALDDNVRVFVAEFQGKVQACMISPFSGHTAYDWYSGTIDRPERGAMHLLLWEAMKTFQASGVRHFDFQGVRIEPDKGSKQEGIYNFKMRFGGRLVRGYMWKYSFRPVKFGAYPLAMRVLRGGDIVDRERGKLANQGL